MNAGDESLLFDALSARSFPPRIVDLRRLYAAAKAAYEAADAHEDESGEEIPRDIRMDYYHWERLLRIEEARVASGSDGRL